MSPEVKIGVIGAGSGMFSLTFVRDLCSTQSLDGAKVVFMDIDPQRLDMIQALACRYAAETGMNFRFEKTMDRLDALQGADFVVNTAMVIGHEKQRLEGELARKYGSWNGLDSWIGFRMGCHHQYRLFLDIVRDMEEICPSAWYLQLANPVFGGCTFVTRNSPIKTVGLCHGFEYGMRAISRVLGLEFEAVRAQAYGLNHFIWLTDFRYEGADAYPLLDQWIKTGAEAYWDGTDCEPSDYMSPKAVDVYQRLGLFPVGDTVTPGGPVYFQWYHTDEETEKQWKQDVKWWWERYLIFLGMLLDAMAQVASEPSARISGLLPPQLLAEPVVPLIDAIVNDKPQVLQVNIPNRGCVPGIADDVVVEIPALVSGHGVQGLQMGPLPKPIMSHITNRIRLVELNLEAFQTGDKGLFLEVALEHRWLRSMDQARQFLDEYIALPHNSFLAEHFK